jgi:hypothetical protein
MIAQSTKRPYVRNSILAGLSLPDLAAIGEFLEPVALKERTILQEPRKCVEHVYFVESGIVSLRIVAAGSTLRHATRVATFFNHAQHLLEVVIQSLISEALRKASPTRLFSRYTARPPPSGMSWCLKGAACLSCTLRRQS